LNEPAARVFSYHGLAVRLAARRPNGRVLVEYLQPKTLSPMASWCEVWPHEVRAAGLTMGHVKSLIVVLPLARFAHDDKDPALAKERKTEEPAPAGEPNDYWFNKI
jgi:hypothetical protein